MRKYLILIILILISTGNFAMSSEWKATSKRIHSKFLNLVTNTNGDLFYASEIIDRTETGICDNTVIFHSSDAGLTWIEKIRIPTYTIPGDTNTTFDGFSGSKFHSPFKSQIVNDSIIYIFLDLNNFIIKSKDFGKTWNAFEKHGLKDVSVSSELLMIDMLDEKTGSAKIYSDLIFTHMYLTDDAWESFELMPFPENRDSMIYFGYSRPEKDVFYFSCRNWWVYEQDKENYESRPEFYYISKTTDRGKTWQEYENNHYVLDLEITMADKNKGYIYGGQLDSVYTESPYLVNVIYQTLDGGESWQRILNVRDSAQGINELVYIDSLNMIASSRYSRRTQSPSPFCFYHTYDGGKTWERKFMEDSTFGSSVGSPRNLVVANKDEAYCKMMWNIFAYTDREVGVYETIGNEEPLLQISPNPVRRGEGAVLSYSGIGMGPVDVSVYDLSGRLIDNFQIRHPEWGEAVYMLPGNIGSGVYIVHFNFMGKNLSAKLVVE